MSTFENDRIVAIGGGSGLSIILKGLKKTTKHITAIVSVGDDGGGSGIIREDLGILPPGDIRSCLVALADDESEMARLLAYRFESGLLKGQSFGNLFIAAMHYIKGNFAEAVKAVSDVLKISGTVLPVTLEDIHLVGELENGEKVVGESCIPVVAQTLESPIVRMHIDPPKADAFRYCIDAILDADIIILGPGSLYTSVIPNLLVNGIQTALHQSTATKIYCCNIMTQPGETDRYTVADHLHAIENHMHLPLFDYVFYNTSTDIHPHILARYKTKNTQIVLSGDLSAYQQKYRLIADDFLTSQNNYIVHDTEKILHNILKILKEKK